MFTGSAEAARRSVWGWVLVFPMLLLASCGAKPRSPAVPLDRAGEVILLGNPAIRTWEQEPSEEFLGEILRVVRVEVQRQREAGHTGRLPTVHMLGLSGGGSYGAFGAGVLCGWTERGDRPVFNMVTGISTGALTAPFAFLGSEYDGLLREVYTTTSTRDIVAWRGLISVLFQDSAFDTAPLRRLMERTINVEMIRRIAAEYESGRLLLVGTCDLDSNRGVIWNMGLIAKICAEGNADAMRLFHDVLMASASIPAAFPPVMIDVVLDGVRHQEMHVDGGTKTQVFLYPPSIRLLAETMSRGIERERRAYIIRNARQQQSWEPVSRRTAHVARRAISALIHTQGTGDLFRIYLITRRDRVDFNLAFIPDDFAYTSEDHFDPVFMTRLFDAGFKLASRAEGYPWYKAPPGWVDEASAAP